MTRDEARELFFSRWREMSLIDSTAAVLGWDEQVMMPPRGASWRASQFAMLAKLSHEILVSPSLGEALTTLASDGSDPIVSAQAKEGLRRHERASRLSPSLVSEMAEVCSLAQPEWRKARQDSDHARFAPWLERIVRLKRMEADSVGWKDHPYDALIDEYEPGTTTGSIRSLFASLAPAVSAIVARRADEPGTQEPAGHYPVEEQRKLGEMAARFVGFCFESGRLDVSTHPFCSGIAPGDCRLTTRYKPTGFIESFFGVLHEAGHGLYEQGIPAEWAGTPLGQAASLGIHESQSRLWENQVGRSAPFWAFWFPIAKSFFPGALKETNPTDFLKTLRVAKPGFIRVEADETTYNLHIVLRFEMETALLSGDLAVSGLPDAWNRRFLELFGLAVPDDRRGYLQDVHWSGGGLGYFPTYTLGNLYASQFMAAARRELPNLEHDLSRGDVTGLLDWLRRHVHSKGRSVRPEEICRLATGEAPTTAYLLAHLGSLAPAS